MMIAISSCLVGKPCRYNATGSLNQALVDSIGNDDYIDICPELLAGLSVPRLPCEIVGGEGKCALAGNAKIVNSAGDDITEKMLRGAQFALDVCKRKNVTKAYLKQNSPTCGCGQIYDGTFTNTLIEGDGVFAALLKEHGIDVIAV